MKPYYQDAAVTIYHGDCQEVLPLLSKADLVLTDPPYGIQAAKRGAHSSIRNSEAWPEAEWDNTRTAEALSLALQYSDHAAVWGGNYYADILKPSAAWLVWMKPQAETGFSMADVELCWTSGQFAARLKRMPRRDGNAHPTQKPVALMAWTLGFFRDANTVLDPFMGSGTTLRAAKDMGRKAIGIDIEERYCEIAARRMAQSVLFDGDSE